MSRRSCWSEFRIPYPISHTPHPISHILGYPIKTLATPIRCSLTGTYGPSHSLVPWVGGIKQIRCSQLWTCNTSFLGRLFDIDLSRTSLILNRHVLNVAVRLLKRDGICKSEWHYRRTHRTSDIYTITSSTLIKEWQAPTATPTPAPAPSNDEDSDDVSDDCFERSRTRKFHLPSLDFAASGCLRGHP